MRVHDPAGEMDPVARATGALAATKNLGFDTLIVDTAGRLHIDDELMGELEAIKAAVEPTDLLYVADAMTGQDAVKSAGEFNAPDRRDRRRADEDGRRRARRRGAVGRRRRRRADRVRGRRRAAAGSRARSTPIGSCRGCSAWATCSRSSSAPRQAIDDESRAKLAEKTRLDDFTLEDFRDQLRTIKKMGPLEQVLGMIPGFGQLKQLNEQRAQVDDKQLGARRGDHQLDDARERRNHALINGSRRKRIARGSGTTVEEVNRVLKQFVEMRKMLKVDGRRRGRRTQGPAAVDGDADEDGRPIDRARASGDDKRRLEAPKSERRTL